MFPVELRWGYRIGSADPKLHNIDYILNYNFSTREYPAGIFFKWPV
jgi:hypothetical protein